MFNGFPKPKKEGNVNPLIYRKWATGTFSILYSTASYTVSGLSFVPSIILIDYDTTPNGGATRDVAFQWMSYDGSTQGWIQSVGNWATKTLPVSKPTGKSFVINQAFASPNTMYARWWAFE